MGPADHDFPGPCTCVEGRIGLCGACMYGLRRPAASSPEALIAEHEGCRWVVVPPCVYCADHDVRLYQGGLPESRREAAHEHDWDYESGQGFYYVCRTCGEREWTE